jgi:hypothetical protein
VKATPAILKDKITVAKNLPKKKMSSLPSTVLQTHTAEMDIELLRIGTQNRPINPANVDNLKEVMKVQGCVNTNIFNTKLSEQYPLSVEPDPTEEGYYVILNGQHRFTAASQLGVKTLTCLIYGSTEPLTPSQRTFLKTNIHVGQNDSIYTQASSFIKWVN